MRVTIIALCGILLLAVLAAGVAFSSYLKGSSFRQLVSQRTGEAFRSEADLSPLAWNGNSVYAEEARLAGQSGSFLRTLNARQMRAEVNWRAAFGGAWRVESLVIAQVAAELQAPHPDVTLEPQSAVASAFAAWLPKRFEIGQVEISDADLTYGVTSLSNTRLDIRPESAGWLIEGRGGDFQHQGFPALAVQDFQVRAQRDVVFLTRSNLRIGKNGKLSAVGDSANGGNLQCTWEAVASKDVFPEALAGYLEGNLAGIVEIKDAGKMSGSLVVTEGLLQRVPVLNLLADFTANPAFRRMPVQEIKCKYVRDGEVVKVTELSAQSKGLMRLEGQFTLGPGSSLVGTFQIGVTPQTLQWLPGSRERVFTISRDGFLWTTLQIGGTIESPTEDLSARLVAAMGQAVIDRGAELLKNSTTAPADTVRDVLDILSPLLR